MEPAWRVRLVATQPNRQRRAGYPVAGQEQGNERVRSLHFKDGTLQEINTA